VGWELSHRLASLGDYSRWITKTCDPSVFEGAMNSPYTEDDLSNPINAADAKAMIVQRAWQACFTPEILHVTAGTQQGW
jgi:hypothetical protein